MTTDALEKAQQGDRRALARLITAAEEGRIESFEQIYAAGGNAYVVGITGPPGAGKSSLVSRLIDHIREDGETVAAVLVDPSSPFTGGAILGDRIRLQDHVSDPGVYARSMASRGSLGGVSLATSKAVAVLDAAGFPIVIVETVGVGQAEVDIVRAADLTVVVLAPGWGDSIQAAKAGLLEIGDIFVVNKADRDGAEATVADLQTMLHDSPPGAGPEPAVMTTVALENHGDSGTRELWEEIAGRRVSDDPARRLAAADREIRAAVEDLLRAQSLGRFDDAVSDGLIDAVAKRQIDPWTAAAELLRSNS